jgi:hypothetical protein
MEKIMAASPEFMEAFLDHLREMIVALKKELAPYESGTLRVAQRPPNGEWVDITEERVAQIKREIASVENTLKRHGHNA